MREKRLSIGIGIVFDLRDGVVRPTEPDGVSLRKRLADPSHRGLLHHHAVFADLHVLAPECPLKDRFPHLPSG